MKTIKDMDITGKRVLIRVDYNVPLDSFQNITDDTRIKAALPTIRYALDHKARLIIASHLGRPGGKPSPEFSLSPVAKRLGRMLNIDVKLAPDCVGSTTAEMVANMQEGDVVLLENLRFHAEEQENEDSFAKNLAELCDIYINDAFAVCHRRNASVDAIVKFAPQAAAGFLLLNELNYFKKAMKDPARPLVAIIGGAKISSKLKALRNLLRNVDKLIIGGAMANTFLKSNGHELGRSKIEADLIDTAGSVLREAAERGIKLYIPVDIVAADEFDPKAEIKIVPVQEIPEEWMALDIGPATSLLYDEALYNAKTIIWNGPMGVFEIDAFSRGTMKMVRSVADSHALTIIGGGDTDVAVHKAGETDRISYISTGGGAFLSLLEGRQLPAVAALDRVNHQAESK
jgi:phosphoglycerate kinase